MSGESMSFDEYCKKNQHSGNCTRLEAFSMGQKSRQAEIDALSALGGMSEQKIDDLVKRNIELQKRINDLKNWCVSGVECNMLSTEYNQALIDMIKILKGKENETRFD